MTTPAAATPEPEPTVNDFLAHALEAYLDADDASSERVRDVLVGADLEDSLTSGALDHIADDLLAILGGNQ